MAALSSANPAAMSRDGLMADGQESKQTQAASSSSQLAGPTSLRIPRSERNDTVLAPASVPNLGPWPLAPAASANPIEAGIRINPGYYDADGRFVPAPVSANPQLNFGQQPGYGTHVPSNLYSQRMPLAPYMSPYASWYPGQHAQIQANQGIAAASYVPPSVPYNASHDWATISARGTHGNNPQVVAPVAQASSGSAVVTDPVATVAQQQQQQQAAQQQQAEAQQRAQQQQLAAQQQAAQQQQQAAAQASSSSAPNQNQGGIATAPAQLSQPTTAAQGATSNVSAPTTIAIDPNDGGVSVPTFHGDDTSSSAPTTAPIVTAANAAAASSAITAPTPIMTTIAAPATNAAIVVQQRGDRFAPGPRVGTESSSNVAQPDESNVSTPSSASSSSSSSVAQPLIYKFNVIKGEEDSNNWNQSKKDAANAKDKHTLDTRTRPEWLALGTLLNKAIEAATKDTDTKEQFNVAGVRGGNYLVSSKSGRLEEDQAVAIIKKAKAIKDKDLSKEEIAARGTLPSTVGVVKYKLNALLERANQVANNSELVCKPEPAIAAPSKLTRIKSILMEKGTTASQEGQSSAAAASSSSSSSRLPTAESADALMATVRQAQENERVKAAKRAELLNERAAVDREIAELRQQQGNSSRNLLQQPSGHAGGVSLRRDSSQRQQQ